MSDDKSIQDQIEELKNEGVEVVVEDIEIPDSDLRYLILGIFRGTTIMEEFPIKMRGVVDNYDDNGDIQTFSIITESGLKYTVSVSFDGQVEE